MYGLKFSELLDNIRQHDYRYFVENDVTHPPFKILPYMAKNRKLYFCRGGSTESR